MKHRVVAAFCIWACALPLFAQEQAPAEVQPVPEQVRVVAQRPGPGMWKVTKGEHVLWIFGTHAPLPRNVEWRSGQVEAAIAGSSEYLAPPGAKADVGFLKGLTLLPYLIGIRKNPDGATLRDLLAPQDYARWTELRQKYLPDYDDAARERPVIVAESLARAARKQTGLVGKEAVDKRIDELVRKHKLKFTSSTVMLPMDNARTILKDVKKSSLNDAACLVTVMTNLERDLAAASARAHAWAKGDIDEIRGLDYAERERACFANIMGSGAFEADPAFKNMLALMSQKWVAAAEQALASNSSTFAVLPIKDILDPHGVVAMLAEKGYAVAQPD